MKAPSNAHAYCECLKQARNDLVAALDEDYSLLARLDYVGRKIMHLHRRLRIRPASDSLSRLQKVPGVSATVEEYKMVCARLSASGTKISQLQAKIRELYVEHRDMPDDEDLKETICAALRFSGCALPIPVIIRTIQRLQFPIHQQQDPLREVLNTVQTLMIEGKIIASKPWGVERTYKLRPTHILLRRLSFAVRALLVRKIA